MEDCGCFGDALKLTPWQTFLKNLVILPMVFVVWYRYRKYRVMELHRSEVALTCLFCIFAMGVGAYCYFNLPLIDFLPYKRGANIYEMIEAQHDTGSDVMVRRGVCSGIPQPPYGQAARVRDRRRGVAGRG